MSSWYKLSDSQTLFVFVHGLFSDSVKCWTSDCGIYWPRLLVEDPRFKNPNIFLADYYTTLDSNDYGIQDCAQEVFQQLNREDSLGNSPPINKNNIIFVTHSAGGIVVRYLLEKHSDSFREKYIGLCLYASPSYGSKLASILSFITRFFNHKLAKELCWAGPLLEDLDIRFSQLLHSNKISLVGMEAYENKAPFGIPFLKNRIVEKISASRYFGNRTIIPGSDHSSIVKPVSMECRSHQALLDFVVKNHLLESKSQLQHRFSSNLDGLQLDSFSIPNFPITLVDRKIDDEVNLIRKTRFFVEFDQVGSILIFAKKLIEGELSGGSNEARSRALAWCARLLSNTREIEKAEECLKLAMTLKTCLEVDIAKAFIASKKGNKNVALNILAEIDLPESRTAALMVVLTHDGSQGAIDWILSSGFDAKDLDSDGKFVLLKNQLELAQWEEARKTLDSLHDDDLRESPVLHHMMAMTYLLSTVPTELRSTVFKDIPLNARNFPLAADSTSIEVRRVAQSHFMNAAEIARQLNLPRSAETLDEFALWLELIDPDESEKGRQKLEAKFRNPKTPLRLVHLGLQFGIEIDLPAVERKIERQIALHGELTHDAAIARFSIAFSKESPEDIANYIDKHFDDLSKFINKKAMRFLQIEMLVQAGLPIRARECLDILAEEGVSEAEENRLQRIIAEAEGMDPIEGRIEQFKQTDSLRDLGVLVAELETREEWDNLCIYGEILFQRTNSLQDAERFANALSNTQKSEQLVEFIKANNDHMMHSKNLRMLYCWALFDEGALLEARTELDKLSDDQDNQNFRGLQINLGIALGDWNSLLVNVANEYFEKDKKNAQELIDAARLALHLGSPYARELVFLAVKKGGDDAGILAAAYFLAVNAGWEGDTEDQWLQKAAMLSGDDGPIQSIDLGDVLNRNPDWDRRISETWGLLNRGEIPIFLAAQSLNKSMIELILFPAFANLSESDPRRRGVILAFSGNRLLKPLDVGGSVGLDITALFTLSYLNLLDKALDVFETVHLPHSTLMWLFEEKRKVAFHQPSRIRNAYQIRSLLATENLKKIIASTVPDSDLYNQVGEELSILIAEAENRKGDDDTQRIVVRPSPVHRVGSLMEEEADLTAYADVICSCQSIVDKLRQKGQITAEEKKKARAYLQLHEKPWPNQPEIVDGAILYLDDLAVTYFLHLGILEKLRIAGFEPFISPWKVSETNELISYESFTSKVNDTIEHIRSVINSRIESGKIKISKRLNMYNEGELSMLEHPTASIIALAGDCNAIISDDRFLNQHVNIEDGSKQTQIFSTLDLIDVLDFNSLITPEEQLEYRTALRRAGYSLVPVSSSELTLHLNACPVEDGKVIETAELKAIRESILFVRMNSWLQLPKEAPWLDNLFQVFNQVLKDLWRADIDFPSVQVRSNWLLDQIDFFGWVHSFERGNRDNIVKTGGSIYILKLLIPPIEAPKNVKEEYWIWVEDKVLAPIKEQNPDLYSWIIDWAKGAIAKMTDMDLTQGDER